MGYRRAGWYAFDRFDNDGIPSAERIIPEFQNLRVGQVIGEEGNAVREIEPNRHLLLSFHYPKTEWVVKAGVWPKFGDESWCWFLKPIDGGERTRLITRVRYARKPGIETIYWMLFEVPDLLSARKQLSGIKRRAERDVNTHNGAMDGKVVLVTGGTGGIGRATAEGLAKLGARVVVVGRDRIKGEAAVAEIKATTGNESVEPMVADLSSRAEIHRLAREFEGRHDRLDVLVNNAGAMYARRFETEERIEGTLTVIHLAPVLLTTLLLPMLQRSAPSRVVNVSSWAHRRAKLDLEDLQSREHYSASVTYSRAKLINVLWTYELARRLEGTGVTVNLADPGGASTEMTRSEAMPLLFRTINRLGRRFMTTEKAARSSIYLASSPEVEGVSGGYFEPPNKRVKSSKASYDEALQKRIWEVSAELAKLDRSMPLQGTGRPR
jgi:NAD(P)-dependent dehydrogenase (short-subunit alcohol dehydrogenase family)